MSTLKRTVAISYFVLQCVASSTANQKNIAHQNSGRPGKESLVIILLIHDIVTDVQEGHRVRPCK